MRLLSLFAMTLLFASHAVLAAEPEPMTLTVPGQGWTVSFRTPPLTMFQGKSQDDNFVFQAAEEGGFNLSIFVEPPENIQPGNQACYEYYWPQAKRNPLIDQGSVKVRKADNYIKVSYQIVNDGPDGKTRIPNANFYFTFRGHWVDVHVSQYPLEKQSKTLAQFEKSLSYRPIKKDK